MSGLRCLLGFHLWCYDLDHKRRICLRPRCTHGKSRLRCWHFWRDWRYRHHQLYTNACRPCRAKFARSHRTTVA